MSSVRECAVFLRCFKVGRVWKSPAFCCSSFCVVLCERLLTHSVPLALLRRFACSNSWGFKWNFKFELLWWGFCAINNKIYFVWSWGLTNESCIKLACHYSFTTERWPLYHSLWLRTQYCMFLAEYFFYVSCTLTLLPG